MQKNVQTKLIEWYKANKRDLPFRNTDDPYKIWISEIMLQQTTVNAVIPYYLRFIERFPTVDTLAKASEQEIYKYWEGLGYYRRAKHIKIAAETIVSDFSGIFPTQYDDIISLKGIGPYTASAICSFAYHQERAAIDGNALRVISRLFSIQDNIALNKTIKNITKLTQSLIEGYDSASFNQGIMDLTTAYCKVKKPLCEECPLQEFCQAYHNHQEKVLPISIKNIRKVDLQYLTGIVLYKNQILLIQNKKGLLENMYGLPQYDVESPYSFKEAFEEDYNIVLNIQAHIKEFKHVFTHRTWYMSTYLFESPSYIEGMIPLQSIESLPIPTAHKKIIQYYIKDTNQL